MLENLSADTYVTPCRIRTLYETLEPSDAKLLRQYVDDEMSWTAHNLAKALRTRELVIDHKTIKRHRDKFCSCS